MRTSEAPDPQSATPTPPSSAVAAADITATPMIAVVSATFGTVASTVSVLPWGENSFRIRKGAAIYNGPGALESQAPTSTGATGYWEEGQKVRMDFPSWAKSFESSNDFSSRTVS